MYKGEWAEKAVAAIQAEGGKMTMQDLADYEVIWNELLLLMLLGLLWHIRWIGLI